MFGRKSKKEIETLKLQVEILTRRLTLQALKRHQAGKAGWKTRRENEKLI